MEPTTFVGLDVHKRTTSVAIAEDGRGGEVRFVGDSEHPRRRCTAWSSA